MSIRVLVVDDTQFMRTMIKNTLKKMGITDVTEAENGVVAVQKYREKHQEGATFDLVTMDITMPEMDGTEALKNILNINPQAVVVMCSALGNQKHVIESISIGAKDFIVKPFQEAEVIGKLKEILSLG